MTIEQDIPEPDKSGSSGSQKSEDGQTQLEIAKPLDGLHMSNTIEGLVASHSKAFGGEVTSALIAGATRQIASDYQELKRDYKSLSSKYEEQRDELEKIRTHNAVLTERIRSEGNNKHLRNLCITIGTGLITTGVVLSRTNIDTFAYGAYGFGLVLLVFGWFPGPREPKK